MTTSPALVLGLAPKLNLSTTTSVVLCFIWLRSNHVVISSSPVTIIACPFSACWMRVVALSPHATHLTYIGFPFLGWFRATVNLALGRPASVGVPSGLATKYPPMFTLFR